MDKEKRFKMLFSGLKVKMMESKRFCVTGGVHKDLLCLSGWSSEVWQCFWVVKLMVDEGLTEQINSTFEVN